MDASSGTARWRSAGSLSAATALTCFALAACGSTIPARNTSDTKSASASAGSGLCASAQSVQRLSVERINQIPRNHEHFTFPAQVAVSDTAQARAVAEAVCALPPMPSGSFSCPADLGVIYRLTFTRDGKNLPAVTVHATGCGVVQGLGRVLWTPRTPGFWNTLATAMGIPHVDESTFGGSMP